MSRLQRLVTMRRAISLLLFASIASGYTVLAIRTLLRSEQIRTVGPGSDWSLAEKVVAFPAFYLGVEPLTGLIINALTWGLAGTLVFLLAWRPNTYPHRDGSVRG